LAVKLFPGAEWSGMESPSERRWTERARFGPDSFRRIDQDRSSAFFKASGIRPALTPPSITNSDPVQ